MRKRYVVGIDLGARKVLVVVWDTEGNVFLRSETKTYPSQGRSGPGACVASIVAAMFTTMVEHSITADQIVAVGLGSMGPAMNGVIAEKGAANFGHPDWAGFDLRGSLQESISGIPVYYGNDANVAAYYGHMMHFGNEAEKYSSVASIIGTGNGDGAVEKGRLVDGDRGMGVEGGHLYLPTHLFAPRGLCRAPCSCGKVSDLESLCSYIGMETNVLPYFLKKFPKHALNHMPINEAAPRLLALDPHTDALCAAAFGLQAKALAYFFDSMIVTFDPSVCFIGGGMMDGENKAVFNPWFIEQVSKTLRTLLREEQRDTPIVVVPDGNLAGARGAALLAVKQHQLTLN
jgi:glucokinase